MKDYLEFSISENLLEFIGYHNFAEIIINEYNKIQKSNYSILEWTYNHKTLIFKVELQKKPVISQDIKIKL